MNVRILRTLMAIMAFEHFPQIEKSIFQLECCKHSWVNGHVIEPHIRNKRNLKACACIDKSRRSNTVRIPVKSHPDVQLSIRFVRDLKDHRAS